jgi:hypothetical protein
LDTSIFIAEEEGGEVVRMMPNKKSDGKAIKFTKGWIRLLGALCHTNNPPKNQKASVEVLKATSTSQAKHPHADWYQNF